MGFIKGNINAILGTILVHLVVIASLMLLSISTSTSHEETYTYIEMEFLEEMMKEISESQEPDLSDIENFDIENYMSQIRNVGSNYSSYNSGNDVQSMSQEELRQKYESELLREKYGDDYEKMMSTTYESYLNESYNTSENSNSKNTSKNQNNSTSSSYSGPALVFVELDNPSRGNSYVHVPVFTCKNGGTVVIGITITNDGKVKSANVISAKSNGDVECISNAAKDAALRSRFTTVSGSGTETGKITYQFIEQ